MYAKNVISRFLKSGSEVSLLDIQCDDLSICFVGIDGKADGYCMLDRSTIFYYIVEGEGTFEINKEKVEVKEGDLVEIPPKNQFIYEGKMKMLEILSQALDESEVHRTPIAM